MRAASSETGGRAVFGLGAGLLLLTLGIVLFVLPSSRAAAPDSGSPDVVLYAEDFEDGQAQDWDLERGWTVARDADGQGVLWGRGDSRSCYIGDEWRDYTVALRLKLVRGRIQVNFRFGVCSRYYVSFDEHGIYLTKTKASACMSYQDVRALGEEHKRNRWYDLRITGKGGRLEVYVDGALKLTFTDPEPLTCGTIGVATLDDSWFPDSEAYVDDIKVLGQAEPLSTEQTEASLVGRADLNPAGARGPGPVATTSGPLARDETWSGVVQVTGDVIVPEDVTLTIQPGTTIRVAYNRESETELTTENYFEWPKAAIYVYGTLRAVGSPGQLIVFTSDAPDPRGADWRGIIISGRSSNRARRSIIRYAIVEYAHKGILFAGGSGRNHIVENCIFRFADHLFYCKPSSREFEGGSAITCWDASSPIVRGNIMYRNTFGLEVVSQGTPLFEHNLVCFSEKRGNYYGGANGLRTWNAEGTPVFRNNLFFGNWWGMEFNWDSNATVENNIVVGNDVGLVVCQGDLGEVESNPTCRFNDVWGNGTDFMQTVWGKRRSVSAERFGSDNVSIDPVFSEQDFYAARFDFGQPRLRDAGNPDLGDADGSRSDIGPHWDWSWVSSSLLAPPR